MSKKLEELVSSHELIIKCKKRAKEIMKQYASTSNPLKLTQCQNLAAQEMKYQHWFELYHMIKNQCEKSLNINSNEKLWFKLMNRLIQYHGTHIHIEISLNPQKENKIRLRLSGELEDTYSHFSLEEIKEKTSFIYHHLFKKECDFLLSQQSYCEKIRYEYKNKTYYIELASILKINGQDIILKVTPDELGNKSLTELGYSKSQYDEIRDICGEINGLLLITGTTGSGMSTTLKSFLNNMSQYNNQITRNISLEIDNQDYSNQIKNALRRQPKFITIGELRDKKSVTLASQSAKKMNTIATLSSHSIKDAQQRLSDLYEEDFNNNLLNGIIHQQLAKVVCSHCSYTIEKVLNGNNKNDVQLISRLKLKYSKTSLKNLRFRNHEGCSHCVKGINGQIICAEIKHIKNDESFTKSQTIKEQAIDHMLKGKIDPHHVEELFGKII